MNRDKIKLVIELTFDDLQVNVTSSVSDLKSRFSILIYPQ